MRQLALVFRFPQTSFFVYEDIDLIFCECKLEDTSQKQFLQIFDIRPYLKMAALRN